MRKLSNLLFKSRFDKRIRLNVKHLVRKVELSILINDIAVSTIVLTVISTNAHHHKRIIAVGIALVANQISRKAGNTVAIRRNDDVRLTSRILKSAIIEGVARDVH